MTSPEPIDERAHVQRGAGTIGRHPCGVSGNDLLDGIDEAILREGRHLQTLGRGVHTVGVEVGAEAYDIAFFGGVGLQALEHFLAVMEDAGAFGKRDGMVGRDLALVPFAILPMRDKACVCRLIAEAQVAPVQILLFHRATSFPCGLRGTGLRFACWTSAGSCLPIARSSCKCFQIARRRGCPLAGTSRRCRMRDCSRFVCRISMRL